MPQVSDKQYDADYWSRHKGIAGASDADSVITPADGKYPASSKTLIARLIADEFNPHYGQFEEAASLAMRTGLTMEPRARDAMAFELGEKILETGFWLSEDGRFGCSPDGLIGEEGGIEFKVPNSHTHVAYLLDGTLPRQYRPQIHWSLIVTGRKWWKWVSWNPYLPPVIIHVEPDEYTDTLRKNMDKFWAELQTARAKIGALIPPPPEPEIVDYGPLGTVEVIPGIQESHF